MPAELENEDYGDGPMHEWFGLSYASYLTIPRTIIQSMSHAWQDNLRRLIEAVPECLDLEGNKLEYQVLKRDTHGRFSQDPFAAYERGRRRLARNTSRAYSTPIVGSLRAFLDPVDRNRILRDLGRLGNATNGRCPICFSGVNTWGHTDACPLTILTEALRDPAVSADMFQEAHDDTNKTLDNL